ncbi:DMT family transporter [Vibrio harveyi]|nr:DMT family transporter [Vibrio harveyi]
MSKPLAYMFIMIGIVALAFSAIMVKEANFEPATNAFLRCLVGFLVLIPFAVSEIKKKGLINKSGFALAIVAGIFLGLDMTSWNFAIFFIGAGISSILLNLQIIIMPLLAMTFDKFKPEEKLLVPSTDYVVRYCSSGWCSRRRSIRRSKHHVGLSNCASGYDSGY